MASEVERDGAGEGAIEEVKTNNVGKPSVTLESKEQSDSEIEEKSIDSDFASASDIDSGFGSGTDDGNDSGSGTGSGSGSDTDGSEIGFVSDTDSTTSGFKPAPPTPSGRTGSEVAGKTSSKRPLSFEQKQNEAMETAKNKYNDLLSKIDNGLQNFKTDIDTNNLSNLLELLIRINWENEKLRKISEFYKEYKKNIESGDKDKDGTLNGKLYKLLGM